MIIVQRFCTAAKVEASIWRLCCAEKCWRNPCWIWGEPCVNYKKDCSVLMRKVGRCFKKWLAVKRCLSSLSALLIPHVVREWVEDEIRVSGRAEWTLGQADFSHSGEAGGHKKKPYGQVLTLSSCSFSRGF